jgi:hypothetical protein
MWKRDRRQFLQDSGLVLGFAAFNSRINALSLRDGNNHSSAKSLPRLFNPNLQTAIGLGDETPGIVDQFGQLDSRHAILAVQIGTTPLESPDLHWSQTLEEGYLPIVSTQIQSNQGSAGWTAYASNAASTGVECFEFLRADLPLKVHLRFPYTTKIEVNAGVVTSGGQILAQFPAAASVKISQAKYNLLTPDRETWSFSKPPWSPLNSPGSHPAVSPGIDLAFASGRASFLFRPLRYKFPVQRGKTYHVVLGLIVPLPGLDDALNPTQTIMKLSANGTSNIVNMADLTAGKPYLHDFVVQASMPEIHVTSATDPSSTSPYRPTLLNAIWIFDSAVDLDQVAVGSLSKNALFYVRCGEEPIEDVACAVTLDYTRAGANATNCRIYLPYSLSMNDGEKSDAPNISSTPAAAKQRWKSLVLRGAQFITGDERLDNLYKTSLINIFLLRTKYAGMADGGQDLYVVKPGATIYDAFWYRDGAYITAALDVAGHSEEAENSLRLFWQSNLPGDFGAYGQQESGAWQAPLDELDSQGQAMWALVHHAQFSGNVEWQRAVYPSIRKGAAWLRDVTGQTRFLEENGERPIYYGLLPAAEGEAIAHGYIYYHDFWAVLGLRMAVEAAKALNEEQDVRWMTQAYDTFCANLSASVKLAYERIGLNKYIPATPFNPVSQIDIWGSIAALYPTRFLEPDDPMISRTLDLMLAHVREDEYTFSNTRKLEKVQLYLTADWAMCYLLRGDLPTFYRLFDGYVAHASPTNAWIEEMFLDSRLGTGDMPHGWAAAQYLHLHRNSLVFEDHDVLHICWGAREAWLNNGVTVKRAPTKFGTIDFECRRNGGTLTLDYQFVRGAHQEICRQVQLHIPPSAAQSGSVRINGRDRALQPNQDTVQLE